MNKSKFLKRSLATLLAVLLVVAMIPMSALAADGDTAEPEAPSSDLHVTVETVPATYTNGAFAVEVKDTRTVTIDWASVDGTTLTLMTKAGTKLQLPYTLDLKTTAEDLGNDVFKLTLIEKTGDADEVNHDLVITVRSDVPEDDTSLREVVRVQNVATTQKAISGKVDGSTITITVPYGMSEANVGFGTDLSASDSTKIFVPTSVHAESTYNATKKQVVVKAGDGRSKSYNVKFVNEDVFSSFSVGDVDAVFGGTLTRPTLTVTVPKGYAGTNPSGWVPKFETTDSVVRVEGVPSWAWTKGTATIGGTVSDLPWEPISNNPEYAAVYKDDKPASRPGTAGTDRTTGECIVQVASERAHWDWADGDTTAGSAYSITYLNVKTKANPDGARVKVTVQEEPQYKASQLTELSISSDNGANYYVATADDIDQTNKIIDMVVDRDFWKSIGADDTQTTVKAKISTGASIKLVAQGDKEDNSVAKGPVNGQWTITNINMKSETFRLRVTAENRTWTDYTVRLTQAGNYNTDITEFKLVHPWNGTEIVGVPNTEKNIKLQIPYSLYADNTGKPTDLSGWGVKVTASAGAVIQSGNEATNSILPHLFTGGVLGASYENGVTTFGDIFQMCFTDGNKNSVTGGTGIGSSTALAPSDKVLYITVSNGTESKTVYTVSLVQADPNTDANITGGKATTAYDNDLVYGYNEGNKLGKGYTGAVNTENSFDVNVSGNNLEINVPYDANDEIFLEDLTGSYNSIYRVITYAGGSKYPVDTSAGNCVREWWNGVDSDLKLDKTWQHTQVDLDRGHDNIPNGAQKTDWFDLEGGVASENEIYVLSEADVVAMKENGDDTKLASQVPGSVNDARVVLKKYASKTYTLKLNRGDAQTGEVLNSISATSGVKVEFNQAYKTITMTVPGSFNWGTYRDSDAYDFTLSFSASDSAVVIDKGQDVANNKTFTANTPEKANEDKYNAQRNEWDQWVSGQTTFFVKNGELYIYDKFTGKETQITEMGGSFDNKAWGKIKGQQAQITVYDEGQSAPNSYRLELVVGERSNKCDLSSVTVGETTVAVSGTAVSVELPAGSDLTAQELTLVSSDMSTIVVNGEAYRAGEIYNVEEPLTVLVTAEDGTQKTYTITVTVGDDGGDDPTPPTPTDKESDKYNDIPSGAMGEKVKEAIDLGLMGSTSTANYVFSPNRKIIRSHFALSVARADVKKNDSSIVTTADANAKLLSLYSGKAPFGDTASKDEIYNAAIEYCVKEGIIKGDNNGNFNPDKNITRLEVASILANWCELPAAGTTNTYEFTDWNSMNWGKEYVNAVRAAGLMNGRTNGSFGAKDDISRAETAVILVGAYNYSAD